MPSQIEFMDEGSPTNSKDAETATSDTDDPAPLTPTTSSTKNHKSVPLTGTGCMVCNDQATSNSIFRRHYGVICCEACKCFFRRTVQMNRDYKCRFEGNCYVGRTMDNLKQVCQACRFQQCVVTGMKLNSVKRFPRKSKKLEGGGELVGSSPQLENKTAKKNSTTKSKRLKNNNNHQSSPIPSEPDVVQQECPYVVGGIILSPRGLNSSHEEELKLSDTDLANVKFKMSPSEAMLYLQSASTSVPQLFKYDDNIDNINEKFLGGSLVPNRENVAKNVSASGSDNTTASSVPVLSSITPTPTVTHRMNNGVESDGSLKGGVVLPGKHGLRNQEHEENGHLVLARKKQCVDPTMPGHYQPSSSPRILSASSISTPPITPLTPITPTHSHSIGSSTMNSPEVIGNVNSVSTYNSPYVTPHGTPVHTPHQSPLPSPTQMHPPNYHLSRHPMTQGLPSSQSGHTSPIGGGGGRTHPVSGRDRDSYQMSGYFAPSSSLPPPSSSSSSSSTFNSLGIPAYTPQLHLGPQQSANPGTIFFNSHQTVPFQVLAPTSLLPMMFSTHHSPMEINSQLLGGGISSSKSPFRIVPIPSINRTQPEELPCESDLMKSNDSSPRCQGDIPQVPGSSPPSARSSPVNAKKMQKFPRFAEAKLEEVLDSLRLRIRSLFTWAKSDVAGFDDLSPLDQKALLRRTVPELVMLGFARGSIAYNDLLLLGRTGQVIRPTNQNSGVASVASVTLQKLVVPLKVLNINDKELALLQEIVLFNPESNGLRNREVVRQYRKSKHLKLMEYTDKSSDDPGRFGELMCLLTPLFEVSTEVTEQLRLEQFVHEGEARIDALLLMSMISGADEIPDENTLDPQL